MDKFATQSEAWRRGYQWAGNLSDDKLDIDTVMDSFGYEIGEPEFEDFLNGAEVKQTEQVGDMFGYDFYDDNEDTHP